MIEIAVEQPVLQVEMNQQTLLVELGAIGAPGPADLTVTLVSGGPLISGRVVILDNGAAVYFQPSVPAHAGRCFGVVKSSVSSSGASVQVQVAGIFAENGLGLDPDKPVWVGANGALSSAPQNTGIAQMAGAAKNSTSFHINFKTFYHG